MPSSKVVRGNPNGVVALKVDGDTQQETQRLHQRPQPLQGCVQSRHRADVAPTPRVAEYSNPGLRDTTPSGLLHSLGSLPTNWKVCRILRLLHVSLLIASAP